MTKHAQLISLAAIAALSLFNGAARAEYEGDLYGNFPMTETASDVGYGAETLATCAEAKRDDWFQRQLQLSEGTVEPTVDTQCRTDGDMIVQAPEQDE